MAAPKPRTITSAAPKPRVPATRTITKSADVEKEKKENANKLAASRTTTVTRTTASSGTGRVQSVTLKKTEVKVRNFYINREFVYFGLSKTGENSIHMFCCFTHGRDEHFLCLINQTIVLVKTEVEITPKQNPHLCSS